MPVSFCALRRRICAGLCDWLGIEFSDRMLRWPAGPRETDGVWSPHWYDAVERSTGFEPWRPRTVDLNEHDFAVAEACRPAYDELPPGASSSSLSRGFETFAGAHSSTTLVTSERHARPRW